MILIKQFSPVTSEKSGLKEDIKFRISQLAPFIDMFVFTGPPRFASKLDDEQTFRRLEVKELEQKAKTNATLYVDTGVNNGATPITGDAGLVPATQGQIQTEIIRAQAEAQKKDQELSSLIVLRRQQDATFAAKTGAPAASLLPYKIEHAKKGEVLEIEDSTGLPYLFLGPATYSRVARLLGNNLLEVESVTKFAVEKFLTMVISDEAFLPANTKSLYFWEVDKLTTPTSTQLNYVAADPDQVSAGLEVRVSGSTIDVVFDRTAPPTALEIQSILNRDVLHLLKTALAANSNGTGKISAPLGPQATPTFVIKTYSVGTTANPTVTTKIGSNADLTFALQAPTVRVKATAFSKEVSGNDLFGDTLRQAVSSSPLYFAVPGNPILRKSKVGSDIPTLEEYASLINTEIPLSIIYAPIPTEQGPVGNFIGNLNLSSLNVTLYDDDGAVLLIQNGEAQPSASVQYKLHREPNLEEEIEIGDVDVTIKLAAPPARVPIRGQLVRGAREISLGVNIATTPGRLTPIGSGAAKSNISEGSIADIATAGLGPKLDKFQDKIGETIKNYSKEPPAKGEYYFNFQAKNAQGETIDLNKYGTIRLFDEVTFVYLDDKGRPVPLQKTSIVGVIEANNTIAIKDGISVLPPPKSTVLVEIPQTPLNPGRKYRVVVSCLDKGTT